MPRALDSWADVGRRVAEARESAGLTQKSLAVESGIERTALAKIELGRRSLSSLELARIAAVLARPIEWFVTESPPSVVSRRAENAAEVDGLDRHIDAFARDVELLIELKSLPSVEPRTPWMPETLNEAESLATTIRSEIGAGNGPIHNLASAVEPLGLYVASLELESHLPDGAYVALGGAGATIVNGSQDPGRRRFTLAHELGHHLMADEYSTDWSIGQAKGDREKRINAFAIHFLMPKRTVAARWTADNGADAPRDAAINLAVDFRVSWTAVCGHLQNIGLIEPAVETEIRRRPPNRGELMERNLFIIEELAPPSVSPGFSKGVLRAFRGSKITSARAIELLRGSLVEDDLPPVVVVPPEALRAEVAGSA